MCLYILSEPFVDKNGGEPAYNRKRMTPKLKISAFSPLYDPQSTYGAFQPSVPTREVKI